MSSMIGFNLCIWEKGTLKISYFAGDAAEADVNGAQQVLWGKHAASVNIVSVT